MLGIKNTFDRFSLNQKVLTLIVIEVLGFCIVAMVAISQVRNVGDQVEQIAKIILPLHISAEDIRTKILNQRLNTREITYRSSSIDEDMSSEIKMSQIVAQYFEGEKSIRNEIASIETLIRKLVVHREENQNVLSQNSEDLLQVLFDLRRSVQIHDYFVNELIDLGPDRSLFDSAQVLAQIYINEVAMMAAISDLTTRLDGIRKESARHAIYVKRIAIGFIVLTLFAALLFFISMLLIIVRRNISKPLQLLTDTINAFTAMLKVEESEFEKGLMLRHDELGRMSRSFNRLKHDLWNQGQDLHTAKEDAERANLAKSMFLASASHDLRQPLHAMQMYIAALRQKVTDKKTIALVDDIDAVSVSTARLLSALLDVSQLEAGAIEPSLEEFPIQDVLNRIYREFFPLAHQKQLELKMMPSKSWIKSDPALLERIIGNYMSNAIRYTQQGFILLGVRRRNQRVSIEVWDTGCGIPYDQTLSIFDDFHQIENEERDRSKGLGLGLAIAKRLAKCLDHEIEVDSIIDQGSRFAVLVDIAEPGTVSLSTTTPLEKILQGLTNKRILLVEDDVEVLKATRELLESWDCIVMEGKNQDEALQIVQKNLAMPPDVIVADNRLPGGAEGVDVAGRIQELVGYPIPTVIVTGDVQEDHLKEIARCGYKVMSKPVQPAKLRALITNMICEDTTSRERMRNLSA